MKSFLVVLTLFISSAASAEMGPCLKIFSECIKDLGGYCQGIHADNREASQGAAMVKQLCTIGAATVCQSNMYKQLGKEVCEKEEHDFLERQSKNPQDNDNNGQDDESDQDKTPPARWNAKDK